MSDRDRLLLAQCRRQILDALTGMRKKPYLPYWGELFTAMRDLRNLAHQLGHELELHAIHPVGQLVYSPEAGKFIARLPDLQISMELEECIDCFMSGRFSPKTHKKTKQPSVL